MYTYPEALNAFYRIALDLFERAYASNPITFPYGSGMIDLRVVADSRTGTASVDWHAHWGRLTVVINMPVKPATYRMTETEFKHWVAYLLHEVGHPVHTDKQVWDVAVARQAQVMLNYLEDVREEKATIDLGLAINARDMFASLIDSLHAKAIAEGYDPNNLRSIGWTLCVLGRAANGYDMNVSDIYARMKPTGHAFLICGWALPLLAACRTTQDCLDLADKVTAAVIAARPKRKPEPVTEPEPEKAPDEATEDRTEAFDGQDDVGPMDEPEPADEAPVGEVETETHYGPQGVDRSEDAPKGESNEEAEGGDDGRWLKPKGEAEAEAEAEDADASHSAAEEEPKPEPEPDEPEPKGDELFDKQDLTPNKSGTLVAGGKDWMVMRSVLETVREALGRTYSDKPITGRDSRVWVRNRGGFSTVNLVTGDASRMGRQRALLAAALKREETDDHEGGRASGRLDKRSLSRLVMGNPYVFGKRTLAEGYDTDVQVLVDGSTSMDGENILAAATLALVVAQACAQVGVDCTAHVFNGRGLHAMTKGRAKPEGKKFAYAHNQVNGSTPLTQNMLATALMQKARAPSKRRIIFLVTDGGCDMGPEVLKAAGTYVEEVIGAEIANLHIGYMPMGIFRNECAVNVTNVPASGVQTLTKVLERGL